jgi:hypothetical protein
LFGGSAGEIAEAENERFADSVMHRGPFAMGTYQTGLAEDAEVFRGVGLLEAAVAVDFADAERPLAKALQDAQAGRICELGKKIGHAGQLALVDFAHKNFSLYFITIK